MIVEFHDFQELKAKLSAIPEEKRKVIILSGRHPPETSDGKTSIAQMHHEEWEKEGATTLAIPQEWTPQGAYRTAGLTDRKIKALKQKYIPRNRLRTKAERASANTASRDVPQDDDILDWFQQNGFDVPILSLHGTPIGRSHLGPGTPFGPKGPGILFLKGYPDTGQFSTRIFDHPLLKEGGVRPNAVLCEYFYGGKRQKTKRRLLKFLGDGRNELTKIIQKPGANVLKLQNYHEKPQLKMQYLAIPVMTPGALNKFKTEFSGQVLDVIRHLAQTGLKAKRVEGGPKIAWPQ